MRTSFRLTLANNGIILTHKKNPWTCEVATDKDSRYLLGKWVMNEIDQYIKRCDEEIIGSLDIALTISPRKKKE